MNLDDYKPNVSAADLKNFLPDVPASDVTGDVLDGYVDANQDILLEGVTMPDEAGIGSKKLLLTVILSEKAILVLMRESD